MGEITEIPSVEAQDEQNSHHSPVERGGILSAIGKISGKFRVAIAAFGLLVGGEIGCAHKPIVVPPSHMQPERQICVATATLKNGSYRWAWDRTAQVISETIRPILYEDLEKYLTQHFLNVRLIDLGTLKTRIGFKVGHPMNLNWYPEDFSDKMAEQIPLFIENLCDDVIGIGISASVTRNGLKQRKPWNYRYDRIFLFTETEVLNLENGKVNHTKGSAYFEQERTEQIEACNHIKHLDDIRWDFDACSSSAEFTVPIEELIAGLRDEFEDLFENSLLKNYQPDKLPPLSPARIEQVLKKKIDELYEKFAKTETTIPEPTLGELKKLSGIYLSRFSASPGAERVRQILTDIDAREERFRLAQGKRQEAQRRIREGKEVRKFRDLLVQGKTAEERGAHEEALGFFMQARNAAFAVVNIYREAEMPIPHEIDSLGNELNRGIRENEGRIGVIHPRPQGIPLSSSEVIWEGFKFYIDAAKAVAVSPEFGAMVVKLVEVSDKIHQDLAREGFTAHLELRIVKPEFLSDKPIQNVDVTVTKKNPPYTSRTFRTTKEGIIEQGGRASFYLRPGQYEITSPVFKDRYTVDIKEGQNSLTIELR